MCTAFGVRTTKHACIQHHHRDSRRLINIIFDMFAHLHVTGSTSRYWQDIDDLQARQSRQRYTTPITTLSNLTSASPIAVLVSLDLKDSPRIIAVLTGSELRKLLFVTPHSIGQVLFRQE
jgi:hypothetical protein